MTKDGAEFRYEMVNIQTGYVIVEHDLFSRAVRSYFTTEPPLPRDEYREGSHTWRATGMGQSFQFDIRDRQSGEVVSFRELLGLLYYAVCEEESEVFRIGQIAHENDISIYVAITFEAVDPARRRLPTEKLQILNETFNERLRSRGKKILILPDVFELHKTVSYGQIMIDFGLTAMEEEG
jgi:hypothetical protein